METKHGRIEKREVRTVTGLDRLTGKENRKGLQTIIRYRGFRTLKGETTKKEKVFRLQKAFRRRHEP